MFSLSRSFAEELDANDPLASYRERFHLPLHNGKPSIYFTGNSLGAMPKSVRDYVETELKDWEKWGVEGHFHGTRPWKSYHHFFTEKAARLVGAEPDEVVMMNSLTVNLHLLLVSFYRPTKERFKIICEGGAFPSDQYALESQVRFHGFQPEEAIVELLPRQGEYTLRQEDIEACIDAHADSLALVMMGGVNYYTGQFFNLAAITQKAHSVGALAGFDLAHAAGNVPLYLHNWNVDFACWCTYKYLNSGPGGTSGVFIHEKHANNASIPRFAGWWGYHEATRFEMKKGFVPMSGAAGWQLSNAQIMAMAPHLASLEIFDEVGIEQLREKSLKLTAWTEYLLKQILEEFPQQQLTIITPEHPENRGCQLSILTGANGRKLFDALQNEGIIADWREPNVIRIAPVPLYNSYVDVWNFYTVLRNTLNIDG